MYAKALFSQYPVITITGPRQSGKTTLARSSFPRLPYKNLEHPETRQFAREDPVKFLGTIPDGAILDETHPLRGALFENMVIGEILKFRYNCGLRENLSFFRDAKGHEERSKGIVTNARQVTSLL